MLKSIFKVTGATVAVLAAGAGCLVRPVSPNEPTTKVNVSTQLRQQAVDKIDLLLAIDNSSSMGDKQKYLSTAVPQLVSRLVTPNCVDGDTVTGRAVLNQLGEGECPSGGVPEFKPITDIHVGIISSSLGDMGAENDGRGAAVCTGRSDTPNANDHAQLVLRTNVSAENAGFLAWFPDVRKNDGKDPPQAPYDDPAKLASAFTQAVTGVGESGCGFEAQLESMYQFLIAPQPWAKIAVNDNRASYEGVNTDLLRQRHDFLRPDSLVAVIMLTDEDDSSVDPLSVQGTGFYFMANDFPGGKPRVDGVLSRTAARGTSACESDPGSPDCTSCAFGSAANDSVCSNPDTKYYDPDDDQLNVRFYDMKRRFGVDPQYNIMRYVAGLSSPRIAHREKENHNGEPDVNADCVNPLFFGGELPVSEDLEELCVPSGANNTEARSANLVFFALIGGIPNELLALRDESGTLTGDAWQKIIGKDPASYDFEGQDSRMIPSTEARPGRPTGPKDADADDPDNKTHREWNTKKGDLQYACTFPLPTDLQVAPRSVGDCKKGSDSPLCEGSDQSQDRRQIRAKAYPTIREARVVHALGAQGILASLCPRQPDGNADSPEYGYNPAVNEIVDRLKNALTQTCLPQPLDVADDGTVPCLMLELMPADVTSCKLEGRSDPPAEIKTKFMEQLTSKPGNEGLKNRTVCQLGQDTKAESVQSCQEGDQGWCYLTGEAAGRCAQQIVFNDRVLALAKGSTVFLQCINQTGGGTPNSEAETEE